MPFALKDGERLSAARRQGIRALHWARGEVTEVRGSGRKQAGSEHMSVECRVRGTSEPDGKTRGTIGIRTSSRVGMKARRGQWQNAKRDMQHERR